MAVGAKTGQPPKPEALRIFLDANVLFSAAKAPGAMRQMLAGLKNQGQNQGYMLVADAYVCAEAQRNLVAKASETALQDLEVILVNVESGGARQTITANQAELVNWLPEKDRPVLLAAIALSCDALVTGDKKHFGASYGQSFAGVKLYSPAQLALAFLVQAS